MTRFLSARQIQIFDYPRFAEPLRDRVRESAAELAGATGMAIEHIAKSHIRKEDVVAKVLGAAARRALWPHLPDFPAVRRALGEVRIGLAAGGKWIRTCMGLFLSSGCFWLC